MTKVKKFESSPKGAPSVFKVPENVNPGILKLRQRNNEYNMKLNKLMKPPLPKQDRPHVKNEERSVDIWGGKDWSFLKYKQLIGKS